MNNVRLENSLSDRVTDQVAWVVRTAQFDSLQRAGVDTRDAARYLWTRKFHSAKGLKRSAADGLVHLASDNDSGSTAAVAAVSSPSRTVPGSSRPSTSVDSVVVPQPGSATV